MDRFILIYILLLCASEISIAHDEHVINSLIDSEIAKVREDFFEKEYMTLLNRVTAAVAILGLAFSLLGFLGVKTLHQIRQEYKDELKKLKDNLSELEKLKQEMLTEDDLIPSSPKDIDSVVPPNMSEMDDLSAKLVGFLIKYSRWSFNAARIRRWGANQSGFEIFSSYESSELEKALMNLFNDEKIGCRRSSKGNNLFYAKSKS